MASVIEELVAKRDQLTSEIEEMRDSVEESPDLPSDETRNTWNRLNAELDEVEKNIKVREAMKARVDELADKGKTETGAGFSVPRSRTENVYDLSSVKRAYDDPGVEGQELKDRARRVLEGAFIPHEDAERVDAKGHVERLISRDSEDGRVSRYLVATDNPAYRRAFPKLISPNAMLTREEMSAVAQVKAAERALSLTGSAGGFAVPFTLDPSIIPTSSLAINPFRAISRVESITTDEWRGVSSAGITAAFAAEATAASDNAPTLAQPTISTEKAQAFIPYSIEVGMDWGSLQESMARLLQDAKDELEATKFAVGSGTNEPQGVLTGATATVTSSTGGAFVGADLFTLEANVPARFRPRASMVMNRFFAQRIRQIDTAGGAQLWIDNLRVGLNNEVPSPGNYGASLLGYGAYESSAMASSATTGSKAIIMGDFSYYLIADRIGLQIEYIPHLFNSAGALTLPTGQRGLYAYWRVGAGVLSTNAFRTLQL